MATNKMISSHSSRVKRAKEAVKRSPNRISIIDREAYVEFYLLEDIVRLYEYRIKEEEKKNPKTAHGQYSQKITLGQFRAIYDLLQAAVEVAWDEITAGNYKAVWRAIPEGALMRAAGSTKNLPVLREITVDMVKQLSAGTLEAYRQHQQSTEDLEKIQSHNDNVLRVQGLDGVAEALEGAEKIIEVIDAAETLIPDKKATRKLNPNI